MNDPFHYNCPICNHKAVRTENILEGYELWVCPGCALTWAPLASGQILDYDDVYATDEYQANNIKPLLKSKDFSSFANHPTYRPFFANVNQVPKASLLDVGCGVGRFCHGAHSRGWDVTGMDVSADAIKIGNRFAPFELLNISVIDMLNEERRFDVVTCFEVLEHLAEPVGFLAQLRFLLVNEGQLFCTVPNWDCELNKLSQRPDHVPPVHIQFFTKQALHRAATFAGFSDIKTGLIWTSNPYRSRIRKRLERYIPSFFHSQQVPLGLWLHASSRE